MLSKNLTILRYYVLKIKLKRFKNNIIIIISEVLFPKILSLCVKYKIYLQLYGALNLINLIIDVVRILYIERISSDISLLRIMPEEIDN